MGSSTSLPTSDVVAGGQSDRDDETAAKSVQTVPAVARFTWGLDPTQRRDVLTTEDLTAAGAGAVVKTSHFASDSDEPMWIQESSDPSDVTRYVSTLEGSMSLTTSLTGDVELQLVDLHGDVVATLAVADPGADPAFPDAYLGMMFPRNEFGMPAAKSMARLRLRSASHGARRLDEGLHRARGASNAVGADRGRSVAGDRLEFEQGVQMFCCRLVDLGQKGDRFHVTLTPRVLAECRGAANVSSRDARVDAQRHARIRHVLGVISELAHDLRSLVKL